MAAAAAAAAPVPPHMLHGPASQRRRPGEELMIDLSQLMEGVREEVTALMLDGVHKTASLCASTCAQHVVAARRQMHQRLRGRNGGTTPNSMPTPTNSTGFLGLTPRHFNDRAVPRMVTAEFRGAPATASTMPCPIPIYTPVPGCSLQTSAAVDLPNDAPSAFPFSSSTAHTPANLTPRMTPSTNGVFQDSLDSSMAYDTLVDTRDAVQSLEDKTRMASRAMELIEEAIKVATDVADDAGTPTAAGQHCREALLVDAQASESQAPSVSTPRGRTLAPEAAVNGSEGSALLTTCEPRLPQHSTLNSEVQSDPSADLETAVKQVERDTQLLQERLKQLDGGSNSRPPSRRGGRSSSPQPNQAASAKHVRGLSPGGLAVTTHKVAAAAMDSEHQDERMAPAQDGHVKASTPPAPTRLAPLPAIKPEAVATAAVASGKVGAEHADSVLRQRESEHGSSQAERRERSTASTYSSADSIPAMELTGS